MTSLPLFSGENRSLAGANGTLGTYAIVSGDFVRTGGMDRANYALARFLADRGDTVHLAAYRVADDLASRPNVVVHRAPKPLGSYFLGNPVLHRVGRHCAEQVAAGGGRVVVNGGNCDWGDVNWMHHVHAVDPGMTAGSWPRRLKNGLLRRTFLAEEKAIVPRARVVIATCERTKRDSVTYLGVAPEKIQVVYLGIDPTIFRPAEPEERAAIRARLGWDAARPTAAFIGALGDRRKGLDTLFAAWSELCRESSWDADLVVVGRGAEAPAWTERAASAGLAGRFRLLGFVRELPDLLRASDGHILPSRYEGYSMVTQEALACGVPALVTASAGIADRFPPALADWLIPDPEDVADLKARLRRWREGVGRPRPELSAFSEALRSYPWDHMAAAIVEVIERTS